MKPDSQTLMASFYPYLEKGEKLKSEVI